MSTKYWEDGSDAGYLNLIRHNNVGEFCANLLCSLRVKIAEADRGNEPFRFQFVQKPESSDAFTEGRVILPMELVTITSNQDSFSLVPEETRSANLEKINALGTHALHALAHRRLHRLLGDRDRLEDTPFRGAKNCIGRFQRCAELALG